MGERIYYAVSIKHSEYKWKFGKPLYMWGSRTSDDETRSFAGYHSEPNLAELYSLEEFCEKYPQDKVPWILNEPVKITIDFCRKYREYDTVLVDRECVERYYEMCELAEG